MFTQLSYDPLDYLGGAAGAKKVRDAEYRKLKAAGKSVTRWTLKNQLRPYSSYGQSDGRVRDVYFLNVI